MGFFIFFREKTFISFAEPSADEPAVLPTAHAAERQLPTAPQPGVFLASVLPTAHAAERQLPTAPQPGVFLCKCLTLRSSARPVVLSLDFENS